MTLEYLILLRLSEIPENKAARSSYLTELINEKIMTTPFTFKAVTGKLRALRNKRLVKRVLTNDYWLQGDGYTFGYWRITDLGRQELTLAANKDDAIAY